MTILTRFLKSPDNNKYAPVGSVMTFLSTNEGLPDRQRVELPPFLFFGIRIVISGKIIVKIVNLASKLVF